MESHSGAGTCCGVRRIMQCVGATAVVSVLLLLSLSIPVILLLGNMDFFNTNETSADVAPRRGPKPYDPMLALYSLYLCKASYCVPDEIEDWSCGEPCAAHRAFGFEIVNVYSNTSWSTLAYTGLDHVNRRVIAAFRGSANIGNWISDLTFWTLHYPCPGDNSSSSSEGDEPTSAPAVAAERLAGAGSSEGTEAPLDPIQTEPGECRVHKGFYQAYHSLSANLTADLLRLHDEYPDYEFLITGHSLGGALAYIAALDVLSHPSLVDRPDAFTAPFEVYTFGEPRSGNQPLNEFAYTLLEGHPSGTRKHHRLTHGRDPVPHLPPMSWGYLHQQQELWYFRNGTTDDNPFVYATCDDNTTHEDILCSNSVWSTSVADHTLYLGTCTGCLCTAAEMEASANMVLPEDKLHAITEDYLVNQRKIREAQWP